MLRLKKIKSIFFIVFFIFSVVTPFFGAGEKASKLIRVQTWAGYIEKDWVLDFEKENNCTFEITLIGTADEQWAKMMASKGAYEIMLINSTFIDRALKADLIQAIDMDKLKNYDYLNKKIPFERFSFINGKYYAIPYTWGASPLAYNADLIKTRPDSWAVLWDPKYKGRSSIRDDVYITWAMVAALIGAEDKWNPTPEQNRLIEQKLRELHENILTYYSGTTEGANLLASEEVLVMYSEATIQIHEAREKGANIQEVIPKEGSPTWLDNITIGTKAENLDLVYKLIDVMISPEWQGRIGETIGYAVAVPDAVNYMSQEMIDFTHMDEPDYWDGLFLFEIVPDEEYERRLDVWNEIKAGK
jgi:spermidine/putrescine-binding protein